MDLYTLGEKKCALYAVIPDNDNTYNFLVSLLYSQVFQTLYYCADQILSLIHIFLATAGKFVVAGEISALTIPDISSIVRDTVRRAGYNCRDFDVEVLI